MRYEQGAVSVLALVEGLTPKIETLRAHGDIETLIYSYLEPATSGLNFLLPALLLTRETAHFFTRSNS